MRCYFCKAEITSAIRRFVPAQDRREKSGFRDVCTTCHTALIHAEGKHRTVVNGVSCVEQAPGRLGLVGSVVTFGWPDKVKVKFRTITDESCEHLVGIDHNGEGHFIIFEDGEAGSVDVHTYGVVLAEAKEAGLKPPFHIYARYEVFQSPNVRFFKLTDKALSVM